MLLEEQMRYILMNYKYVMLLLVRLGYLLQLLLVLRIQIFVADTSAIITIECYWCLVFAMANMVFLLSVVVNVVYIKTL